jgi:cellulose synthase operon protein C
MGAQPARFRMNRFLASLALGLALPVLGQSSLPSRQEFGPSIDKVQISGVVREVAVRLAAADHLAADQRWQDAIDEYLDLLRAHGDDLVPIEPATQILATGQRFLQTRWLIHERVGALGSEAWKAFRHRSQSTAQQRFDRAAQEHDLRQLRRVVDEAFCCPAAAQALELLGDLAFERGDFAEAQYWWRLLAWPASLVPETGKHRPLLFPDLSKEATARVRAKQIVVLLFQEQAWRVPGELKAYRLAHGPSQGVLAGRQGLYADLVEQLLQEGVGKVPAAEREWHTFGGDPSRNSVLPAALESRLWAEGPAWRVRLESGDKVSAMTVAKSPIGVEAARQLAFHPIVVGNNAYVADARFVRGFDLRSGRPSFQYDLLENRDVPGGDDLQLKLPAPAGLHYTLTAARGYLLARLGAQWYGPPRDGEKRLDASWLVCLRIPGPATAGADPAKAERWVVPATVKDAAMGVFEGAPVVHGKSVSIVESRLKGFRTLAVLRSFDLETGALRWEQELALAPEFDASEAPRCQHHLLTLVGPWLIYCSHAGAVVAVDAGNGQRVWAVRYASQVAKKRHGSLSPRDPCPALAAGHQVLVAPGDLGRLLCLDAATGRGLWERESLEVDQLLGISHDLVVFTTPHGLRALRLSSGDDEGGWCQPTVGSLRSCGRGLLAGDRVFWPTLDPRLTWRAPDVMAGAAQEDPGMLRILPPGNMVSARGCLVIATGEELWGFVPAPLLGPSQT